MNILMLFEKPLLVRTTKSPVNLYLIRSNVNGSIKHRLYNNPFVLLVIFTQIKYMSILFHNFHLTDPDTYCDQRTILIVDARLVVLTTCI